MSNQPLKQSFLKPEQPVCRPAISRTVFGNIPLYWLSGDKS
jgi:hypothetical protein